MRSYPYFIALFFLIINSSCNRQEEGIDPAFIKYVDLFIAEVAQRGQTFKSTNVRGIQFAEIENSTTRGTCNNNSERKELNSSSLDISQIGDYVLSAYEDSKGNLWFGTLGKGIARYDGSHLKYFKVGDGLPSNRVPSVIEDSSGIYWFSTGKGLSRFDGQSFTNFIVKENDWASNTVNQLFIDSKGELWIGTWGGVYKFDGKEFTAFPLPYPTIETTINQDTKDWITEINEDSDGNMWFARDGYGACKFNGESFIHFLKKDGLHSNYVTEIEFDNDGHIWFGTRVAERDNPDLEKRTGKGGVNKLINGEMISFPEIKGFNRGDVYKIHKEVSGDIWIATIGNGVYRYSGNEFKNYAVPTSIVNMMTDKHGNIWLAGVGALYKINEKDEIINITKQGPWR